MVVLANKFRLSHPSTVKIFGMKQMKQWIKIERIPGPLASCYEKASRLVIGTYYSRVAEEIVSVLSTGIILDLGTGPGYLPIQIVKRSPSVRVVGIDLSRKLINMARRTAAKAGLTDRLDFRVGNAGRLPFGNESFDMVISTGMLHSLRRPVEVFREIYRVLKKDGEAWIYDPAKVASSIDSEKWKASLTLAERFSLWFFKMIGLHRPLETYKREQVVPMIKETDFTRYTIEETNGEIKIKLRK